MLALAGWLAACAPADGPSRAAPFAPALRDSPPEAGASGCWHRETLPALYETVREQRLGAGGQVIEEQRQVLVRDRREVWFAVPCEPPGVAFTATLQRALKARGLYDAPVTGTFDTATRTAVRRYQAARGLDSATLSLAAAKSLGLVVTPPE